MRVSAASALRLAVAIALQAAHDIREGARILRRSGNLLRSDLMRLELSTAVEFFETKNGLWAATCAALDCDEVKRLTPFERDLALVRRWLDEHPEHATEADIRAHRD